MDVKKVALLVGALVIAVVTAVMAKNMFAGAGAPEAAASQVAAGPKILVARKALPVGTIIDQESLTFQPWPKELVQNAYYQEGSPEADMTRLIGTVVRNAVTAGQPVTQGALVGPNDRGFLSAALGPGMRAVTVPVSTTNGVAGFVFPGDRIDHRGDDFHALTQIPRPPVRRSDVVLVLPAVLEVEDATVFKEAIHHGRDPYRLANSRHPRPQSTDPTANHVDRHPGLARPVQCLHDLRLQ